jgi:phosphate starvation-inducible PhoH-like protein
MSNILHVCQTLIRKEDYMGAKRKASRNDKYSNVVDFGAQKKAEVKIIPRSKHQEQYILKLLDPQTSITFGIGPAGTGKTMLAVQAAVKKFKDGDIDRIIVTRPACSADEDLGFLPGTLEQKMAPWTRPIFDVLREYFNAFEIENMIQEGVIEIAPLAFMRGRTFKNAFIIADEMQNTTVGQMKMLLTRIGEGSEMAITGDLAQADYGKDNGLVDFMRLIQERELSYIDIVQFERGDVERHVVVKEVLEIYGED